MATKKTSKKSTIKFIVSDEKNPQIELKKGMKFRVEAIELVDNKLSSVKKGAARLCGGTSTCLALIDVED